MPLEMCHQRLARLYHSWESTHNGYGASTYEGSRLAVDESAEFGGDGIVQVVGRHVEQMVMSTLIHWVVDVPL